MKQQRQARCYSSTTEETLTSPLPTLPSDLVVEILCRLPVKFLLQFRSVCKLWNSLISDSKFANKHLHLSTTHRINSVFYSYFLRRHVFESYPLNSIFSNIYINATQLECPPNSFDVDYPLARAYDRAYSIVASCNGIVCLAYSYDCLVLLWNPSIRKFKELPYPDKPKFYYFTPLSYGFGYDHVNDNYKVVVVFPYSIDKTHVMVHTLGTNFWKSVEKFPLGCDPLGRPGRFVSGTINWLPLTGRRVKSFIVSFDLRTESYRKILQPDYGEFVPDVKLLSLGVLRECLCLISYDSVWIMKEFGNKDSWTKIFTNTYKFCFCLTKAIYMFEDDQLLLEASYITKKLILHDPKTGTTKFINFKNDSILVSSLDVYVESLISPWS